MPRKPQSAAAPGVFLRGKTFWLRYTNGAEQIRISLETSDRKEAIKRAEERRGRPQVSKKTGKTRGGKTEIEQVVEKYIAFKLVAPREKERLSELSAKGARQAIKNFCAVMGVISPSQITSEKLAEYYCKLNGTMWKGKIDLTHKRSEATAQTYLRRVATFARWCGFIVTTPETPATPARDIVIPSERVDEMLDLATGEMKFILFCGFRAGMRRGEIGMARPAWFDFARGLINIPRVDPVTGWEPKTSKARSMPLMDEFRDFILSEFPDWKSRPFCIAPNKVAGKWIYRHDFRKKFEVFAKKHCPEMTRHSMRHSYASHLADGDVGIAQLSAWTGDEIATLQKHYLHLKADAQKAEEAFAAHKAPTPKQARAALEAEKAEAKAAQMELRAAQAALLAKVDNIASQTAPPETWQDTGAVETDDTEEIPAPEKILKRRFEGGI